MSDTSMKPNQFNSVMDQDLSSLVGFELGSKYVVYKILNAEGKFVQWSLVDTELKQGVAHHENYEEFLNIITTLKGLQNGD